MSLALQGIGVSRGIAIGRAHVIQHSQIEVPEINLAPPLVEREITRFLAAVEAAKLQLNGIREHIPSGTPADIASFIDTHLLMLDDVMLKHEPVRLIREHRINAEWALRQQRDALVAVFEQMDDPYLRTRKDDVEHVFGQVMRVLMKEGEVESQEELRGGVVFADDLTPADTVLMQSMEIAAFVTESGGPLSHTAILARSLRIPAVVAAQGVTRWVRDGDTVVIDGDYGDILVDPDERSLEHYRLRARDEARRQTALKRLKGEPARTRDGLDVQLYANIELPDDVREANRSGADGVGLFRTEFLYMNRADTPSEEEQYAAYHHVVRALKGRPVTIRTLDLGADKQVDAGRASAVCNNPALGLRAIRLCLHDPALFRPQLRAILRVSAEGPVRLMLPMISNLDEVLQVRLLIEQTRQELQDEGIPFDPKLPVGGMIEVPAAAISAHLFARHLDFFSVGTNDLIQYTLAIDRTDEAVNYLYAPLHPAVLRLIQLTLQAGRRAGIPVSMCGEMAGDPYYAPLLLGMGLTEFSMQPAALLEVKRVITEADARELQTKTERALHSGDPERLRRLLDRLQAGD